MTAHTGPIPAVVVTGASSGIGRELARVAAREGRALLLLGRSETALGALEAELKAQGATVATLAVALESPQAVERIDEALAARGFYCDVLVNSAGFGVFGAAAQTPAGPQLNLIDVNLRALVALNLHFLPGMVARRRGGIINVGSLTGFAPAPYAAAYSASKAFVRSFTAAVAAEVAGSGVTVTNLAPGVVRTPMLERYSMGDSRMFKILPRGSAAKAAEAGWRAFKAGRSRVIPRPIDRFVAFVCWIVPDRPLAHLIAWLQRMK